MEYKIEQLQAQVTRMLRATIDVCEKNGITYYLQAGSVLGTIRHQGPIPWDADADIIIPNDQIDWFVECAKRDLPKEFYVDYYKVDSKSLRQFPRVGLTGYNTNVLHVDVFRLIGLPDDESEQLAMIEEAHKYTRNNSLMRKPAWKLLAKGRFKHAIGKMGLGNVSVTYYIEKFDELCNRYPYSEARYVMNPSGKYGKKNIFDKSVYGEGIIRKYLDFEVRIPSEVDLYLKQYYNDYMQYPPEENIKQAMEKIYVVR